MKPEALVIGMFSVMAFIYLGTIIVFAPLASLGWRKYLKFILPILAGVCGFFLVSIGVGTLILKIWGK